jgi:hypothetical protein
MTANGASAVCKATNAGRTILSAPASAIEQNWIEKEQTWMRARDALTKEIEELTQALVTLTEVQAKSNKLMRELVEPGTPYVAKK